MSGLPKPPNVVEGEASESDDDTSPPAVQTQSEPQQILPKQQVPVHIRVLHSLRFSENCSLLWVGRTHSRVQKRIPDIRTVVVYSVLFKDDVNVTFPHDECLAPPTHCRHKIYPTKIGMVVQHFKCHKCKTLERWISLQYSEILLRSSSFSSNSQVWVVGKRDVKPIRRKTLGNFSFEIVYLNHRPQVICDPTGARFPSAKSSICPGSW